MKTQFLLLALFITNICIAQCPFSVTLSKKNNLCFLADTLVINSSNKIAGIKWYKDGVLDTIVGFKSEYEKNGITVAGGNGYGTNNNQVIPNAILVDGNANLYVSDFFGERILKFPPNSNSTTNGIIIAGGNGQGFEPNQFFDAGSIFFDSKGYLFVAERGSNRIKKFPPGSTRATNGVTVAGGNFYNSDPNSFRNPSSVFVDAQGNIFVADSHNDRIQKFLPDSTNGITVAGGNGQGSHANQFHIPGSVFVDADGYIFVSDNGNNRIQKFPPTATSLTNGITIAGGNGAGSAANQLNTPGTLFLDAMRNIYVADRGNNRIQKFPSGSTSLTNGVTIAGGNGQGNASDQFNGPVSVYIDDFGNIFVADYMNNRVQKFIANRIDSTLITSIPGSYTAVVTDTSGCIATTNAININNKTKPGIIISANNNNICSGNVLFFTAVPTSISVSTIYKWQVNGNTSGANSSTYSSATLNNGDVVNCIGLAAIGCAEPYTSNSIIAHVKQLPVVSSANNVTINQGQNIVLNIPVTGNITSYLWSPAESLSDNTILHPVATPVKTTVYLLKVISFDSCAASGTISVKVSSPIRIPNSFSPNGDGLNDIFYLIGGIERDLIKDFSIYNRWGKRMFQVKNILPNNRGYGWDGTYKGELQSGGNYTYIAVVISANGTEQMYNGALMLIR